MINENDHKKLIKAWKKYSLYSILACLRNLDDEEEEKIELAKQKIEKILYK